MIVFLNNHIIDEKAAHIAPSDRGFTLGDGVFDTLLCVDGKPQQAREHFTRLLAHAAFLRIKHEQTPEVLEQAALTLLKKNRFLGGRHALRTMVTRGQGERGLTPPELAVPTTFMRASPVPDPAALPPVHAVFALTTRRNEHSPFSRIKSLQYGDNMLALLEAQHNGANEALMLNTEGHVVCATTSNVFILEEGRVLTPPLSDGALDGITRAFVMHNIPVKEHSLSMERLLSADGVYLTNSINGIRPVEKLNATCLPSRNGFYEDMIRNLSRPAAA